jgi:hypothetical protein
VPTRHERRFAGLKHQGPPIRPQSAATTIHRAYGLGMKAIVLAVLALGCGGSKKPAPPPPAPVAAVDPAPCDDVAANEIKLLKVDMLSPESKQSMHDEIVGHCTKDGWSVDARICFTKAADFKEMDGCKSKLTKAQLDATKPSNAPDDAPATN